MGNGAPRRSNRGLKSVRTPSTVPENSPATVTPSTRPHVPWRVIEALPRDGFCLHVRFMDGLEGIVDMAGLIHSSRADVFAQLADPSLFAQVFVEHGAVTWPGEIDLAPDAMHAEIKKTGKWVLA
jgi:hypothetical protein